jgi:hypothetical protein
MSRRTLCVECRPLRWRRTCIGYRHGPANVRFRTTHVAEPGAPGVHAGEGSERCDGAECRDGHDGERRNFFRVRAELDVSISADTHVFTAMSVNLCPGGLLVSTYRALPHGIVVGVEFDLPASRVVAQAMVRWSFEGSVGRVPGYGIAFTDLTRFDRTLIESFCARLAPEAYPRFASSRPPAEHSRLAG